MPKPRDLAIVSCHFNPCGYRSRERNLLTFLGAMKARDLPVFVAELIFPNQTYVLPEADKSQKTFRFAALDVMWHKERLINLAVARLPAQYTKVAWIDADVLFPDEKWYERTSALLDDLSLIQLYDRASQQDNEGNEIREVAGLAGYIARGQPNPFKFDVSQTWPGLAWAARRSVLAAHGLWDVMVLGGADTYMSLAAFGASGASFEWHLSRLTAGLRKSWQEWSEPFFRDVQGRVGFLPGAIAQLGHGKEENRGYVGRMDILTKHSFDPARDIAPGALGLWSWSSPKPALHSDVAAYFERRKEDNQ